MFDINVDRINNRNLTNSVVKEVKGLVDKIEPNAFYIAIVVNTNDPYKLGRVQIRIPAIHGVNPNQTYFISDSSLPWARPAILNGAGNDMGQFIVPSKGTRVVVSFEANDLGRPLYFGGVPTLINNTKIINDNTNIFFGQELEINTDDRITDLSNESAQQVIYKSLKGSTIIIDDKDGHESIKIIDAAGQQIIMENDSEYTLPRRGNKTNPIDTASISIISGGTVNIKCKHFNLECETTNVHDDYCHDSTPPDTSGAVNVGTFKGHTYAVYQGTDFNWDTYKADCEAKGGHLATPDSPAKNDYVYSLIRDLGFDTAYFGLYRNPSDLNTWYWIDGTVAEYQNWAPGEPNNSGGEYYGMFYYKYTDGTWNDGTPNVTQGKYQYYICEWDYV